jgi:hypothetical protein
MVLLRAVAASLYIGITSCRGTGEEGMGARALGLRDGPYARSGPSAHYGKRTIPDANKPTDEEVPRAVFLWRN